MTEFLTKLVEFTEPLVIGSYALTLIVVVVFFSDFRGQSRVNLVECRKNIGLIIPFLFVITYALGLVGDEVMYFFVNQTGIHDWFIDYSAEKMTVTPKEICSFGGELKNLSHRDIQGLLTDFPISIDGNPIESTIISRADYSARLSRGIAFYSLVAIIFSLVVSNRKLMLSVFFLVAFVLASVSFFAIESTYHRSANYDAVRYLMLSKEGKLICKHGFKNFFEHKVESDSENEITIKLVNAGGKGKLSDN